MERVIPRYEKAGLVPILANLWSEALNVGLIVMAVFADRIAPCSYVESVPGSRKMPGRTWGGSSTTTITATAF